MIRVYDYETETGEEGSIVIKSDEHLALWLKENPHVFFEMNEEKTFVYNNKFKNKINTYKLS
jgi:nitroimidazol reductase NimA-like FMN-containing flavoprotein (pyridoxamine 5'-phosphate oxidase superfamily)